MSLGSYFFAYLSTAPKHDTLTDGGIQSLSFITEPNLYRLVTKSKLPSAIEFERWVFEDVLPSLRKFGMYASDEVLNNPDLLNDAIKKLQQERAEKNRLNIKNGVLEEIVAEYAPKIDYLESILQSHCDMTSTQIAADYGISACRLNKILNAERIHRKVGGQWVLYVNYMEMGLIHSETIPINGSNGAFVVQTKWTQQGRLLIHELLTHLGYVAYYDAKVRLYQLNNY